MTTISIVTGANIMLLFTVPMLPVHFWPPALAIMPVAEFSTDLPDTTTSALNGIHAYFVFNPMESGSLMDAGFFKDWYLFNWPTNCLLLWNKNIKDHCVTIS
jgi:hypothetical protein